MKKHTFVVLGFAIALGLSLNVFSKTAEPKYAWLAGRWIGEGLGGTTETLWSPPAEDGTMVGVFRLFNADGSIMVYQFLLLDEDGLRIKHFNSELKGWESQEEYVTFEMVNFTEEKIEMKSLVYEKISQDEIETRLEVSRDGKIMTETLTKRRAK